MALTEATKDSRRIEQGREVLRKMDGLLNMYEKLDQAITQFIAQDLHIDTDTTNVKTNDDTPIAGNPDIVWSELFDAKDLRDFFADQVLNASGTSSDTAIADIAEKRGFTP